jgi:biotin-[acetyl-CoA-carboxylase] ligase BirA-like protein
MSFEYRWLNSCESTSRLLKSGQSNGFTVIECVAAGTQTGGVGRLGSRWESAEGNLHLSMAVPARYFNRETLPLTPLWLGGKVAQWIESRAAVAACLKWPNDILIDGKKVAGLLCEAVFHGQDLTGVVFGIGINLRIAPAISAAYTAGSILDLAGVSLTSRDSSFDLAEFLTASLDSMVSASQMSVMWSRFGIRSGHFWRSRAEREWYTMNGVETGGGMLLSPVKAAGEVREEIAVTSASHGYEWSLLMSGNLLVADVGNSRTKLALMGWSESGSPEILRYFETDSEAGLAALRQALDDHDLAPVAHAISVNPAAFNVLRDRLAAMGVATREISRGACRVTRSDYDLNVIGIDRLAALEWVYQQHALAALGWPVMVVSLGTATTIDVIDGGGRHLGGLIGLGIGSMLEALSGRGALLPKLTPSVDLRPSEEWPRSSHTAMTQACVRTTVAWIREERRRLASTCGVEERSVVVVLHGGFAATVSSLFGDDPVSIQEGVTLRGAAILARNGR